MLRPVWLIGKGVLIEATRRREIYAIVILTLVLFGVVLSIDFFGLPNLEKFYREVALRLMSIATALTVLVLAARQLPREFQQRTIYPILAKPISRPTFLLGKLLGVMMAAAFCLGLFVVVYIIGAAYLGQSIPWGLFIQYIYLQLLLMLVLASMSFLLSMLTNLDAAITIGVILYLGSAVISQAMQFLYDFASPVAQWGMVVMTYVVPQVNLFDLSAKTVHAASDNVRGWDPLGIGTMIALTAYGIGWTSIFTGLSYLVFRRRAI